LGVDVGASAAVSLSSLRGFLRGHADPSKEDAISL
jgi:hypothetical protein